MAFKSVTGAQMAAEQLIRQYSGFQQGTMAILTDATGGPKTIRELVELRLSVQNFADVAKGIMAMDSYAALDANLKHDVELIANESAAALEEIDLETDHDTKWAAMDAGEKADLIRMARAHGPNVDAIRARLNHERPGQAIVNAKPTLAQKIPE